MCQGHATGNQWSNGMTSMQTVKLKILKRILVGEMSHHTAHARICIRNSDKISHHAAGGHSITTEHHPLS